MSAPQLSSLLRRPADTLSGVMWLPRFIDKARMHLAGTLPPDYAFAFCHPRGVDGVFLAFFGLEKDDFIEAVKTAGPDDAPVAAWFLRQRGATPDKIAEWNATAPQLGRPGFPMHDVLPWTLRKFYHGPPEHAPDTMFKLLDFDEGR
jgi:Domain of unknown function (DUF5069)